MPAEDEFSFDVGLTDADLQRLDDAAAKAEARLREKRRRDAAGRDEGPAFEMTPIGRAPAAVPAGGGAPWDARAFRKAAKEQAARERAEDREEARIQAAEKKAAKAERTRENKELREVMNGLRREHRKTQRTIKRIGTKWENQTNRWQNRTFLQKVLGGGISSNPQVALSFFKSPLSFVQSIVATLPILGGIIGAKDMAMFVVDELVKLDRFFKAFIDRVETRRNQFRNRYEDAQIAGGLRQLITTTQAGSVDPRDAFNTFEEYSRDQMSLEARFAVRNTAGV